MRLTQRLLLGALLIVGFLAAMIIVVVDRQIGARLSDDARTFLSREARLVGDLWVREPADPDALANRTGEALDRRVTLVASDGTVVGDSEFDGDSLRALQNHRERPEIAAAIAGGIGMSRRPSPRPARRSCTSPSPSQGSGSPASRSPPAASTRSSRPPERESSRPRSWRWAAR